MRFRSAAPSPPPAPPERQIGRACLRLLQGSPRRGRVCQPDGSPRGEEDLRGPESGRRNTSLRDTNCGHHVGHRRRIRPSVLLTAVARPSGRAPQSAPPRPHPFCAPVANQEPGRAGVPPLHAALGSESGRIFLRMTPPPQPARGSAPGAGLASGRGPAPPAWSSLLGMGRWRSWRPGQIFPESHSTCPSLLPFPAPEWDSHLKIGCGSLLTRQG